VKEDDYDVGYGRPPKGHRFRPGQSGNPRGRPKGTHNVSSSLRKVASQKVRVNGKNGSELISKHDAIFTQLINKAAGGNIRAILEYIKLLQSQREEEFHEEIPSQTLIQFVEAKDGRPDYSVPWKTMLI
jgi:hypothetical protein